MALAGVFVFWGGSAEAAKIFPADCASVGGTLKDGVCYIGDGTQAETVVEKVNDEWTLTKGDMVISGGSGSRAYGINNNAYDGGTGTISNTGAGTLTISGGSDSYAYGIYNNASGSGSHGTISNEGEGTLTITGGSYSTADGIYSNAYDGGTGTISNTGAGTLTITAGSGYDVGNGIDYNASGSGSHGTITNTSAGTLTITGGSGYSANGLYSNAYDGGTGTITNAGEGTLTISGGSRSLAHGIDRNASGSGSHGTITNTGAGTLTITGGSRAHGIDRNAYDGGTGTITNVGEGTLTISGGSGYSAYGIFYNAFNGGTGTITNAGEGTLTITGGSRAHGISYNAINGSIGTITNTGAGTLTITAGSGYDAYGIGYNAYGSGSHGTISNEGEGTLTITGGSGTSAYGIYVNGDEGGIGTISNTGAGTLTITGGSGDDAYGIEYNTTMEGTGTITNTGAGTLTITGGSGPYAYGISYNAYDGGTGTITNTGTGTLTIMGGSGKEAYGIDHNAYDGGTGTISNTGAGTLSILGNLEADSYGIATIAKDAESIGRLENAGVMNLNKNAIESFGYGDALVTNHSTGTVNAEAEAIFAKAESSSSEDSPIGLLNPVDGMDGSAEIEGFVSSGTTIAWDLKDDWANHSVWEDGGTLNITDVVEGSLAAQQIKSAFTELFGTGTTLNFLGEDDWASEGVGSSTDAFTASVGNALIDQGYAGNIVTNFNLNNASSDGTAQALTIGTGKGEVIKDSLGFRQVEGVSSVTVNSGKYFALIGLPAGGELIEGGAPVTLDNGTLMLGITPAESARTDSSTAGTLETVTMKNGSKIETENMWVQVASVNGQGDVSLTDTGRMYVKEMTVEGDVDNQGTLSADSLTIANGTLTSSKTLKSSGTIRVEASARLVVDGVVAADKIDAKGVVKLGKSVAVYQGAAAIEAMRRAHEDVAAELDRLEGKAEVSTMSVLERIVAESMKRPESEETDSDPGEGDSSDASESSSTGTVITSHRRAAPVLPQDAQAFAAFDAVKRIAADIERGTNPDGHGLWVKLQTGESEFGARAGSKFEIDSDGAVIGAEAHLNPSWKVGGAVSYFDGEIDAGHAKNNWTSYGLHGYVQYKEGAFGVKGTAGWLRGTTEAAEDYVADVWHAGVRAEYDVPAGSMTFTPFVGARVMSGSFDGLDSQTAFSLPIGVALSGTLTTGGWTIVPSFEAAYVRSMGDTEAEDLRILPKDALEGVLSFKATKGAWTGELSYRGATGGRDYEGRAFMAKVGCTF